MKPSKMTMRLAILGSGSGGNAVVVESAGRRILIDAGFSCRQIEKRLAEIGVGAETLEALILTHEHGDHVRGADVLASRYGLEVYATAGTLEGTKLRPEVRERTRTIRSGEPFEVLSSPGPLFGGGGFRVEPFTLPHDAREPIGLVVEDTEGRRMGLVADLGTRSRLAWGRLRDLDALVLETNHDLQMLRQGPYPWHLKERVAGRHGHLSNDDAAGGLAELVSDRLRWVVLYHLSQTNNLPALALHAVGEKLVAEGSRAEPVMTRQDAPTEWLEIGAG